MSDDRKNAAPAKRRRQVAPVSAKRDPCPHRAAYIEEAKQRVNARPLRATVAVSMGAGGSVNLEAAHSDEKGGAFEVTDVFATSSNDWVTTALADIINVAKDKGKNPKSEQLGAALAFISAVGPQDELEAALAQQMFAAHDLSMAMAREAKHAQSWAGVQQYGNLATKMMRTFTAQLDALGKHRRGGEQVVRHVHQYIDNRGGQAIIAENVQTGGARDGGTISTQPYGAGALGPALLGEDPAGHPLPIGSDEGKEAMPAAWGPEPRRAEG